MNNIKDKNKVHTLFQNMLINKEKYFNELYNEYSKLVYQICFSIIKSREESEDITQIVFSKLLQMPNDKWPSSNELTWLYSVTKNETMNYIKSKKKNINIDELYNISEDDNFTNDIIDKDVYNKLINKLNKKEQEVVSLKVLGNLSFKEISKLLDTPIGTVQYRYYKGINTLKLLITNISLFCISLVVYVINKRQMKTILPVQEDSTVENDSDTQENTENSLKENEQYKDEEYKNKDELPSDVQASTQVPQIDYSQYDTKNNVLFSIWAIFLIISIIFLLIFIKYQQKLKLKLSK